MINYDDFAKIEIKIGQIVSVELIEGADKLLKCTVDVGEKNEAGEPTFRQILSGIREYIEDPQTLVGKKFPYIVNLEPRVIRGFESQGMILAASTPEGAFAFLAPSADLPPGTKIK